MSTVWLSGQPPGNTTTRRNGKRAVMSNTSNSKNRNNNQSSDDDWIGELIWSLTKAAGQLLWWAILFPTLSIPAVLTIWVAIGHGARAGLLTAALAVAAYTGWAVPEPSSFTVWVTDPVRQRWLTWWRYGRNWASVCTLHGLTARLGERTLVPALRSVRIGSHADVLTLRVLAGQSVNDWQKRGDALAAAWRAERLTIRATTPASCGSSSVAVTCWPNPSGCPCRPRQPRSTWPRCGSESPRCGPGGNYPSWASTSWWPVPPGPGRARCCGR